MSARPLLLVGNPRTGSTLLTTLLLQHPDIHMHGELFHPEENERRGTHSMRGRPKASFDPSRDDAIDFLDQHVFGVATDYRNRPVEVVGLKVFADHVAVGGARDLFARMHARYPDAHVLHMRRDDYLSVLISLEFAQRSRQWVAWSHLQEPRREVAPFAVSRERARGFFEHMHRADAYFALHFAGPGYLPVHYEDLVDDLPKTMAAVFESLRVTPREVSSVTEKQVGGADWDLVTNLEDLRAEFAAFRERHEIQQRPLAQPSDVPEPEPPPGPTVNVPAVTLRLAARGIQPPGIVKHLSARGADATVVEIEDMISSTRAALPAWLIRPLEPVLTAVILTSVPLTVSLNDDDQQPQEHSLTLAAGITAKGGMRFLGIWDDARPIDLAERGVERVVLLLAEDEDVALAALDAGMDADVIDDESLLVVREGLRDVAREDLRSRATELAGDLHAEDRLAGIPEPIRQVVVAPLHLRAFTESYRGLAQKRSPFPSVEAAVDSLALLARSGDPQGTDDRPWPPWRPRHTAAIAGYLGTDAGAAAST